MPFEPHPTDPNLVVFKSRKLEFDRNEWRQHANEYERGFIDGMQKQMQSSVDKAVNAMGKREWVGLTDREIEQEQWLNGDGSMIDFARAIEAKLKEKNT